MSSDYPFHRKAALAASVVAAFLLLTPASVQTVRAQAAQQAALSGKSEVANQPEAPKPEAARPAETPTTGAAAASRGRTNSNVEVVDLGFFAGRRIRPGAR